MEDSKPVSIVVMGVQGIGKSTIGILLAERLGVPFVDGDGLHSRKNIDLMASGQALSDSDREPWLEEVGATLAEYAEHSGVVVACSALRHIYRDRLRALSPSTFFVEPHGPIELVSARITKRDHDFMPANLLQSQYDTLETLTDDESGIRVSITATPQEMVDVIVLEYLSRKQEAS
ncbi:gluconokinase [Aquiluna sp. Uisw_065]|uniref:gluconokinase n=1 Tax=Aquiluna sp. Uisw_065 TaxID=3230967 RepID=UPI0039E81900